MRIASRKATFSGLTASPGFGRHSLFLKLLFLLFLLLSVDRTAQAASLAECRGFGGTKFCFSPDNNKAEGKLISGMSASDACSKIGVVGGKANNGGNNFEIVPPGASPTLSGQLYLVNYCTNLPPKNAYFPSLWENSVGCSGDASLVAATGYSLCVPGGVTADKNAGSTCTKCGNPINFSTGNKIQVELDYKGATGLSFSRVYNSTPTIIEGQNSDIGANWRHNYKYVIRRSDYSDGVVKVYRPDGRAYGFANDNPNDPNSKWFSDADVTDNLTTVFDQSGTAVGWEYRQSSDGATESYGPDGQIQRITFRNGDLRLFNYSDATTPPAIASQSGLLISVADQYGRSIQLRYDSRNRIIKMIDPAGSEYMYGYDESNADTSTPGRVIGNLTSVTYPDGKKRIYWYNEPNKTYSSNFPTGLTGITDENGDRFATYRYDFARRAISSEHGVGIERYTISYDLPFQYSTVTEPLGAKRMYRLTAVTQMARSLGEYQTNPVGTGIKARTFDANGNISSTTDFNGNRTEFTYDLVRNLEIKRIEAAGTPYARTIMTQWHDKYQLPMKISEPLSVTNFTYDASGNLTVKSIQATQDATGANGFSAPVTGNARVWTYSYNEFGQVKTVTDPNQNTTTYDYDASGNLSTVTNPLKHVTTLSNYDANGRIGQIVDPNGLVTTLTYWPRGWLKSKTVGTETTSYDYDGVGQLKKVTFPDTSYITYIYDGAHRLTDVIDSLGNKIHYTLDNFSNRTNEQVSDPSGTLSRQISRQFDTLNRLQQVTGGAQ
jgi:YD repeat-containing protein